MILYETAKRLERRSRLQSRIGETEGDIRELVMEKRQVEDELLRQADEWSDASGPAGAAGSARDI